MKTHAIWLFAVVLFCGGAAACGDDDDDDTAPGDGDADSDADSDTDADGDGDADADGDGDGDADGDGDGDADCQVPEDCPDPASACQLRTCDGGVCGTVPMDCSDAVDCTDDACDEGACVHTPNPASCEEPAVFCDAGLGCVVPPQCDELTPCPGAGSFCAPEQCVDGACAQGANPCAAGRTCGQVCNEDTDACALDDTVCDDLDPCTRRDVCDPDAGNADGVSGCVHEDVDPCDDGVSCTDGSCTPGQGCSQAPNDGLCPNDSGLDCALDGTGACSPASRGADPATGCVYDPSSCQDDGFSCTVEACVEPGGCTSTPDDGLCDDGDRQTEDTCVGEGGAAGTGCVSAVTCATACAGDIVADCGPVACGYFGSQNECVAACEADAWDLACFITHSGHNMCVHFMSECFLPRVKGGPAGCG